MGNSRISPLAIIIILVLIVAVGFVVVSALNDRAAKSKSAEEALQAAKEEMIVPVITVTLSSEEPEQEKITISVVAKVNDKEGIESIILPDGSVIPASEATYEVTENGTYEFGAKSVAGGQSTTEVKVENIRLVSADNPYIPEGFEYVGGDVTKGYTIQDKFGNQYVWVPCANGRLERDKLLNVSYVETSDSASSLVNSVAKYYGFYIARFEASSYDTGKGFVAASRAGQIPWTNVTYNDALNASKGSAEFFNYEEGIATNLVSSYAWDTTLKWIDSTFGSSYSTSLNYGNYDGSIKPTGTTQKDAINNICDLAGNVREWTTEIYEDNTTTKKKTTTNKNKVEENVMLRVVRGGSANLNRTAAAYTAYAENTSETYWGFRTVLYKN